MAESKDELIRQAEAKYAREQLIAEAEAKWAKEQAPQTQEPSALGKIGQFGSDVLTAAETQSRSALEGFSLGMSEPVVSGINAFTHNLIKAGENPKDVASFLANAFSPEKISAEYQADVERRRQLKASMPISSAVAEMAGAILPAGLTSLAAKPIVAAGTAASEAIAASELGKRAAAIPGAGIIGRAAEAAAIGAGIAGTQYGTQKAIEEAAGFAKPGELPPVSQAMAIGAALPGAASAAIEAGPAIAKGAGSAGLKLMSGYTGVPEDVLRGYLKDPDMARAMIKEALLPEGMGRVTPRQAIEEKVTQAMQPIRAQYAQTEKAAVETAALAKEAESKVAPALAQEIINAGKELKSKLISESEKSLEILRQQPGGADLSQVIPDVLEQRKSLLRPEYIQEGDAPPKLVYRPANEPAKKAVGLLDKWSNKFVKRFPDQENIRFSDLKVFLKDLDSEIRALEESQSVTGFPSESIATLRNFRRSIDAPLKGAVPEYRAQMEQNVAPLTQLASDLNEKLLPKGQVANQAFISKVSGLKPLETSEMDMLSRLGTETGRDFVSVIQARAAKRPVQGVGAMPAQYTDWIKTADDAAAAQEALTIANQVAEKYGPLMEQSKTESVVKAFMLNKSSTFREYMKQIASGPESEFERNVNAARMAEGIIAARPQGSKRTIGIAGLFTAGGAMASKDPVVTALLSFTGTSLGMISDHYGGRMAQKVLDAYLSIKGVPTVSKLTSAFSFAPEKLRNELVSTFARGVAASPQELFEIPKEERKYAAIEIQNSPSLTPMQKAKASSMIINQGMIDADTMKLVMLSQPAELPMPQSAIERIFTPPRQARE